MDAAPPLVLALRRTAFLFQPGVLSPGLLHRLVFSLSGIRRHRWQPCSGPASSLGWLVSCREDGAVGKPNSTSELRICEEVNYERKGREADEGSQYCGGRRGRRTRGSPGDEGEGMRVVLQGELE